MPQLRRDMGEFPRQVVNGRFAHCITRVDAAAAINICCRWHSTGRTARAGWATWLTITLRGEAMTATITARGAELSSLRNADGTEMLWQAGLQWRGAPILFDRRVS